MLQIVVPLKLYILFECILVGFRDLNEVLAEDKLYDKSIN